MEKFERKSGSGNWLVTYSDFITLLLTFFVLLYVLTPGVDEATFRDFISYFQASTSVIAENSEASERADRHKLRAEWQNIKNFLEENGLASQVEVKMIPDGVKVTLSDALTFNSGSAKLLPKAKKVLNEMAGIFDREIQAVKVEGHTDNVPIAQPSRYQTNWHLGAARAVSVIVFIREKANLHPSKYEASSFGKHRPIASNATAEGRRQNRRIEIYIQYKGDEAVPALDSLSVMQIDSTSLQQQNLNRDK